jgi:hypothetical protein
LGPNGRVVIAWTAVSGSDRDVMSRSGRIPEEFSNPYIVPARSMLQGGPV